MIKLRSGEVNYIKPSIQLFLGEYNTLLASILVENIGNFAYLASPVINRMEAQTHFYEKIEKYIQLYDMLEKDKDLGVIIADEDSFIYEELRKKFKARVVKEKIKGEKLSRRLVRFLKNTRVISFIVKTAIVLSQTMWLIIVSRKKQLRREQYGAMIRTYFDHRCMDSGGTLSEEYFRPFAVDLARQEKLLVVYKLLHLGDLKLFLKLSSVQTSFDSCLLETFLTPLGLIKALLRFSFSGKIKLKKKYFYRNQDIALLLQKMLDREFYALRGINVYIEYEIAKHIMVLKPGRLYFPYENQTWEKVYPLARKETGNQDMRIIGFQHAGLSYKILNYFPSQGEKKLPLFPDKIVTVGKIFKRLLEEKAFYPSKIVEGAALRHAKFIKNGNFDIKLPRLGIKGAVAYAFSYDIPKYRKIFQALIRTFENSRIQVYLKIHPIYKEDEVMRSLNITLPPNFQLVQKMSWESLYDSVDCVVYDDNSIGLEGLMSGVKTFMLDVGEPIYNCERMFYFDLWETTINTGGLEQLKNSIENKTFDKSYDVEKIAKYLNLYYNIYSKEKYFHAFYD